MNKELVSVIAPVYNVAGYVEKCLDSILAQTYTKIEIILIDDGSTDGASDICDKYAEKDKRIKVFHQKNKGVAEARNKGLEMATGKYITFIDPDDVVNKWYIEILLNLILENNADVSACGMSMAPSTFVMPAKQPEIGDIRVYTGTQALEEILYQKELDNALCWKMYRSSIIKNVRFPAGIIYEDYAAVYDIFSKAKKVVKTDDVLYYYVQRHSSEMHAKFSKKFFSVIDVSDQLTKTIAEKMPELNDAMRSRSLNARFHVIRMIDKKKYRNEYEEIKKYIKKNRARVFCDKKVKLKTKLGILLSYINVDLIRIVYRSDFIKKKFYMR